MESDGSEEISVNLIHYPVYSLGVGKRIGIWFQGCTIRCEGCISAHTWDFNGGYRRAVEEIVEEILRFEALGCDGITISGGEPFDQPEGLHALLKSLRHAGFQDIMTYSGHAFEGLRDRHPLIIELIDVIIDGGFVLGRKTDFRWKGSDNQRMIVLSNDSKLQQRYRDYMERKGGKRILQIIEKNERAYIIGIPDQKDVEVIKPWP
jgi:anaerobic ribonucleoside-triphosphate reductase activating protein